MKKIKIIAGILAVLLILFIVALLAVGAHLGEIVKAGIEAAGPKLTQTTVTVDAVDISLLGGSAGLKNFAIGNPEGYKAPQSITFGKAAISLVPGSVLADKVVIRSIEVRSPEITFEGNPLGANNLKKLMDNVDAFARSPANNSARGDTNSPTAAPPNATPAEKKAAKKLEVDDFILTGVKVHADLTGLVTKQVEITIPDVHLSGLGTGPDGITAADLTRQVLNKITAAVLQELATYAKGLGEAAAKNALNNAETNAVKEINKGLKGLLRK